MSEPSGEPRRLAVYLESVAEPVGFLDDVQGMGGYRIKFTYTPGYRGPSLSASMPPRVSPYEDAQARTFFDNLLPEGSQRGNVVPPDLEGARPFDQDDVIGLLSVLGGECPGAVMVIQENTPLPKTPGILSRDYDPLTDQEVEHMILAAAAGREPDEGDRVSLPGVQRKVSLTYIEENDVFLRATENGIPSTHFFKVEPGGDPRFKGIIANEVLCMRIAASVGLPVADVKRVTFNDCDALLVRRYDREVADDEVHRIHQEDAAQALGLDRTMKYDKQARKALRSANLMDLLGTFADLTAEPAQTRSILRRAAFLNWLLGNNDAHMKNFSLLHHDGGAPPVLAPLYDIVSVEALPGGWREMAMPMSAAVMAPAVNGNDIKWLASLETGKRSPSTTMVRRRLSAFREMAALVPTAIDAAVLDDDVTEEEARPLRAIVAERFAILNRDLGWGLEMTQLKSLRYTTDEYGR